MNSSLWHPCDRRWYCHPQREPGHGELKAEHGKKHLLIWSARFVVLRGDFPPGGTDQSMRASASSRPAQSSTFAGSRRRWRAEGRLQALQWCGWCHLLSAAQQGCPKLAGHDATQAHLSVPSAFLNPCCVCKVFLVGFPCGQDCLSRAGSRYHRLGTWKTN